MRTLMIVVLSASLLLVAPSAAPRADENPNEGLWGELCKAAQEALVAYEKETKNRLGEIDGLFDLPKDKVKDGPRLWRMIVEEEAHDATLARANAFAAELADKGELGDAARWIGMRFDAFAARWDWLGLDGEEIYTRAMEMQRRVEAFVLAEDWVEAFTDQFKNFATPLDEAVDEARKALSSRKKASILASLEKLSLQMHLASMLDDVWENCQEALEEVIDEIEDDAYGDVDTWFDEWPFDRDPEEAFEKHRLLWKRFCEEKYNAMREAEGDGEYLMEPIIKGTFLQKQSFKQIGDWLVNGSLAESLEFLVQDLEKAAK